MTKKAPVTKVFADCGWGEVSLDKPSNQLKVYQKGDLYFGVQRIGNVMRLDCQQVMMGIFPGGKILDNQIVPKKEVIGVIKDVLTQIESQSSQEEPLIRDVA